jgi:hypothetical protein
MFRHQIGSPSADYIFLNILKQRLRNRNIIIAALLHVMADGQKLNPILADQI